MASQDSYSSFLVNPPPDPGATKEISDMSKGALSGSIRSHSTALTAMGIFNGLSGLY